MALPTAALQALKEFILARRAAAAAAPEQKMLQGVYRGYAGDANASPIVHYHGGTYTPGETTNRPLFMSRDKKFADSYAETKGGKTVALAPKPRRVASQKELDELARRYVPDNEAYGYTPASALDANLHDSNGVADIVNELWNREYDAAKALDVDMYGGRGGATGEVLIALPGENIAAAPTDPIFAATQRKIAEYYAAKRAAQTGESPRLEMLLVDPFSGRSYNHSTAGMPETGFAEPMFTRAKKLAPEDVVDRAQLYKAGGPVRGGLAQVKECTCGR